MYSKSISNVFDLGHFELLEGLYPSRSGQLRTTPGFKEPLEVGGELRMYYFSSGSAVIKSKGKNYVVRQHDVFFAFPGRKYLLQTDTQTFTELWWVEVHGPSVGRLMTCLGVTPEAPLVSGIANPSFFRELRSIVAFYDDLLPGEVLGIVGGLYKLFAILLEECTTSEWTVVPHDDEEIIYTGNWVAWPSPFGGNHEEVYTASRKAFAEYNFYGTGIKWFGTMNFDCGKADVIIDGNYQETVDTYSPVRLAKQLLYSNAKLPLGNHIVKIFCTGEKNDKATNCDVVIESFQYLSSGGHTGDVRTRPGGTGLGKKAAELIQAGYSCDLSVEGLAEKLGVSRSYLTSRFKAEMGVSPAKYLINFRLGLAKRMLCTTDLTIGEIAAAVGYPDAFYFSRLFRREENLAPSQYRQLNRVAPEEKAL